MEVMSSRPTTSTLNPYAPPFVPVAYRKVEDYSPEWWQMVESSAEFRDYWLRDCFPQYDEDNNEDEEEEEPELDEHDTDSLFHSYPPHPEEDVKGGMGWEVMVRGTEKWRCAAERVEGPRYLEKTPKYVNVKVSPRMIQQPR